ncbi:hypothetical protein BJ322DRAFT_287430 [Thelephora terrestris]|uniref:F-box domain-containing protein n=1 Tax=Thelephora terrestris TaxID=56493 RepID=A0A9P6L3N4_9AGAM|nr:hypothetical protein BJ322DRAFT_287430 [Thelephora terrestris]
MQWALRLTFTKTAMPLALPPEIIDLIVGDLHNEPTTLKACCLVSKSWVSRTRRHLFARVNFGCAGSSIDSWMKAFPDPSNSPARYTRSLCIHGFGVVSTNVCAWIHSFRHVEHLSVNTSVWRRLHGGSLIQLHGLSPTLKSLRLSSFDTPISQILCLICSFPLLQDLSLRSAFANDNDKWASPSTSPKLTGSLLLNDENLSVTRRLLELPDGLHFSGIRVRCRAEDLDSKTMTDLVSKCSHTLETLSLGLLNGSHLPPPLDLSGSVRLKCMKFGWAGSGTRWITTTIQTARSEILQQITIYLYDTWFVTAEETSREWYELDGLLVQLWTSRSILPNIVCWNDPKKLVPSLLPELTRRGFVRDKGGFVMVE